MPVAVTIERRARLAVFLTSFHPGSTTRQMVELIRRLDPARFCVHAACLQGEGGWERRVAETTVEVREFPVRGFAHPSSMRAVRDFAAWCRQRSIEIVQACDFQANVIGLAGAALARVPLRIGSRHEIVPDRSRAQVTVQRVAYQLAHRVVANSPAASRQLTGEGVSSDRIRVIPNGLDLDKYHARVHRTRIDTLITVGSLRPEKGYDELLEAFSRLTARRQLRLRLVGDGPHRAALERRARDLGIAGRVAFLGHREDVPDLLGTGDVFVCPSRSEAFPNAVLEAMAVGLPVIASAVGGLLDLISDGHNGLLVPPRDAGALATAIDRLVAQPTLAASLGESARRLVRDRYSFERMVASFEHLYLTELGARLHVPLEPSAARELTVP
jgi:glycosyltransferase involved in cell wall biosynthesis